MERMKWRDVVKTREWQRVRRLARRLKMRIHVKFNDADPKEATDVFVSK